MAFSLRSLCDVRIDLCDDSVRMHLHGHRESGGCQLVCQLGGLPIGVLGIALPEVAFKHGQQLCRLVASL